MIKPGPTCLLTRHRLHFSPWLRPGVRCYAADAPVTQTPSREWAGGGADSWGSDPELEWAFTLNESAPPRWRISREGRLQLPQLPLDHVLEPAGLSLQGWLLRAIQLDVVGNGLPQELSLAAADSTLTIRCGKSAIPSSVEITRRDGSRTVWSVTSWSNQNRLGDQAWLPEEAYVFSDDPSGQRILDRLVHFEAWTTVDQRKRPFGVDDHVFDADLRVSRRLGDLVRPVDEQCLEALLDGQPTPVGTVYVPQELKCGAYAAYIFLRLHGQSMPLRDLLDANCFSTMDGPTIEAVADLIRRWVSVTIIEVKSSDQLVLPCIPLLLPGHYLVAKERTAEGLRLINIPRRELHWPMHRFEETWTRLAIAAVPAGGGIAFNGVVRALTCVLGGMMLVGRGGLLWNARARSG